MTGREEILARIHAALPEEARDIAASHASIPRLYKRSGSLDADARRALGEAGRQGIGCLCLTVGAATDVDELRRVFGTAAHATVGRPEQLSRVIGPLFRVALNRAVTRRRKP